MYPRAQLGRDENHGSDVAPVVWHRDRVRLDQTFTRKVPLRLGVPLVPLFIGHGRDASLRQGGAAGLLEGRQHPESRAKQPLSASGRRTLPPPLSFSREMEAGFLRGFQRVALKEPGPGAYQGEQPLGAVVISLGMPICRALSQQGEGGLAEAEDHPKQYPSSR